MWCQPCVLLICPVLQLSSNYPHSHMCSNRRAISHHFPLVLQICITYTMETICGTRTKLDVFINVWKEYFCGFNISCIYAQFYLHAPKRSSQKTKQEQ